MIPGLMIDNDASIEDIDLGITHLLETVKPMADELTDDIVRSHDAIDLQHRACVIFRYITTIKVMHEFRQEKEAATETS